HLRSREPHPRLRHGLGHCAPGEEAPVVAEASDASRRGEDESHAPTAPLRECDTPGVPRSNPVEP
ncbi:hypothetical protein, partial [Myxococcus vastator]|uniref:hypothetical protein n=1 Tax=Myxococcus vastator TaxID=2709664 RepID=UPI001967A94E